jgi:Astacin (Peptidase family M12A)
VSSALAGVIQFVPQTTGTKYVTFNFNPGDTTGVCESSVGMARGQQFISCSTACATATLVHEIGHVIGLLHEHQLPDRTPGIRRSTPPSITASRICRRATRRISPVPAGRLARVIRSALRPKLFP